MVWSYGGQPDQSPVDALRLLIGDTDTTDPLLQDEEIGAFLTTYGINPATLPTPPYFAAAAACEAVAAKFARGADKTVGRLGIKSSQSAIAYERRAVLLRKRGLIEGVSPYAGGISVAQKQAEVADGDRVRPAFTTTLMDFPGDTPGDPGNPDDSDE